jgi:hypothetical protein
MQRRIGAIDEQTNTMLGKYPLYFAHNVLSIESIHDREEKFGWLITESERKEDTSMNYYFYIDGKADDPFGHWVFESAIYLPLFFLLKKEYPSLRLLSMNPKKYKDVFYKGFGLEPHDISLILEPTNIVIFTQWNSLGDHNVLRRELFLDSARSFYTSLVPHSLALPKSIDILYLPRGSKENFKHNDRTIPAQPALIESIQSLFPNTVIYDTDTTSNICEQISILRSSKIILLDYGSSLLVNGYFAENSLVIVLGDFGHIHCKNPKPYLLLQETLRRGCNYIYIPVHYDAPSILGILAESIQTGFQVHQHKYTCWRFLEGKDCDKCESSPL